MMREGKIVPVEITMALLEKEMRDIGWSKFYLIDGFPRDLENLEGFLDHLGERVDIRCAIWFDIDENISFHRVILRSEASDRVDDNPSSLDKRFSNFNLDGKTTRV
ncbi:UMP-CMP kinase [Thelohanellus kitauei]|uniref:UMP-CMP kinase n=1 Tax=Thelohanellus kitauei TaxID=669202 RepID=A0A0C2IF45_THEKT|nr:UMP-CMP kinase [Thelohanellus kitauei]